MIWFSSGFFSLLQLLIQPDICHLTQRKNRQQKDEAGVNPPMAQPMFPTCPRNGHGQSCPKRRTRRGGPQAHPNSSSGDVPTSLVISHRFHRVRDVMLLTCERHFLVPGGKMLLHPLLLLCACDSSASCAASPCPVGRVLLVALTRPRCPSSPLHLDSPWPRKALRSVVQGVNDGFPLLAWPPGHHPANLSQVSSSTCSWTFLDQTWSQQPGPGRPPCPVRASSPTSWHQRWMPPAASTSTCMLNRPRIGPASRGVESSHMLVSQPFEHLQLWPS